MKLITIDFETYYDRAYGLGKMTTQEYLSDDRFEVICVAVKVNYNEPVAFSGDYSATKKWLEQFDWGDALCVAHNAIFDGGILELVFDIHPAMYLCTMMTSRPYAVPFTGSMSLKNVGEFFNVSTPKGDAVAGALGVSREAFLQSRQALNEYIDYCKNDVNMTAEIASNILRFIPVDELRIADLHIKKFTQPQLHINKALLQNEIQKIAQQKEELLATAGLESRDELMSNNKFAELLQNAGVIPGQKISPTTGKTTYAFAKTDEFMRELQAHEDPYVQALAAARVKSKSTIEETRMQRFINIANTGHPLSVPLLYAGTHTLRSSGLDSLNLQNLPRGSALRHAITAPPGKVVIAGDLSQIEARMVACMAGQDDLVQQFADDEDVYSLFASDIYGVPVDKDSEPEKRFVGKTCILQLGYGAGPVRFRESLAGYGVQIDPEEAKRIVYHYREKYSNIKKLWTKLDSCISRMVFADCAITIKPVMFKHERVVLPNGVSMHYPELAKDEDGYHYTFQNKYAKNIYGGALTENIIQALARIVLRDVELTMSKAGYNAVLNVHDELIYVVDEHKADGVVKLLERVMTTGVDWMPNLPIACEVAAGRTYGDCK